MHSRYLSLCTASVCQCGCDPRRCALVVGGLSCVLAPPHCAIVGSKRRLGGRRVGLCAWIEVLLAVAVCAVDRSLCDSGRMAAHSGLLPCGPCKRCTLCSKLHQPLHKHLDRGHSIAEGHRIHWLETKVHQNGKLPISLGLLAPPLAMVAGEATLVSLGRSRRRLFLLLFLRGDRDKEGWVSSVRVRGVGTSWQQSRPGPR